MGAFVKSVFTENNGDGSQMRVVVTFIVFVYMIGWFSVVIRSGSLPAIGATDIVMLLGSLGWKYAQKGKEESTVKEEKVNG